MRNKTSIVTSAADSCGNPSSIRPMDNSRRSNMKRKEPFKFTQSRLVAICASTLLLAGAGIAQAVPVTIFQETFSPSATGAMTGMSPTTDSTGATWQFAGGTGNDWLANGDAPAIPATGWEDFSVEYLPYTLSAGNTYTLTVSGFNPVADSSSNSWLAIGFFNSTCNTLFGNTSGGPWMLLRQNGYVQGFGGPSAYYQLSSNSDNSGNGAGSYSVGGTATIVLNTNGPASSDWTANFSYNDVNLGSITYNNSKYPSFSLTSGVGFLYYSTPGASVSSLSLTATPEPATIGLMAMGGLGLLMIGRKRAVRRSA